MKLVRTKSLEPGAKLAQSIRNENGLVLIHSNVSLTNKMIKRLLSQGINYVYLDDELTKGIDVDPVIPNELRAEAINNVKEIFLDIKGNGFFNRSLILDKGNEKLLVSVEKIIEEMKSRDKAVSLLADIMLTDDYTFQHSLNVAIYSLAIGIKLNLTDKELSELALGAILHDIGKMFTEETILGKPDKLTDEEFEIMKEHAQLGYDYLRKQTNLPIVIAQCAYQHHERLDGSGYPRGLRDDEIHKYAKIIAIADVFDAVTTNRVYRKAMIPDEALEVLYVGAIDKYDREMIKAFRKGVVIYPTGIFVQLSDGRIAIVFKQNKHLCDRPIVKVIKEQEDGQELRVTYEVDLAFVTNVMINSCHVE